MNRSARDAEKRQAKLQAIDQQVAEGSLTIRTMTEKERRRFGIDDPERPFKRFFVPGAKPGTKRAEEAYQQLARQVRKSIGTAPMDWALAIRSGTRSTENTALAPRSRAE